MSVLFFPGTDHPSDARYLKRCCLSIHTLETRRKPLGCDEIFIDSGAFTTIDKHGGYPKPVFAYAYRLWRLWEEGVAQIAVASTQDYMCEPKVVAKLLGIPISDLTPDLHATQIRRNQAMTIERYDELLRELNTLFKGEIPFAVLPVLQGYEPADYVRHIRMYGARLTHGMWVGAGSVCKRNGSVEDIVQVLSFIKSERPDLRLHGFGLKTTALKDPCVRAMLHSSDSMAWSDDARKVMQRHRVALQKELGRDKITNSELKVLLGERGIPYRSNHDVREILAFVERVENYSDQSETAWQLPLPLLQEAAE